ncbi:unnamed protein product [Soboliphyme baturini]|uniref:WS_DGAT_C domain-containing protein n=1 Tax=Soboliphyme baturini TaxID=241478 RepID=A0A183J5D1_9BILA|nr:unnamed protein product [Soboliphyme baturini]
MAYGKKGTKGMERTEKSRKVGTYGKEPKETECDEFEPKYTERNCKGTKGMELDGKEPKGTEFDDEDPKGMECDAKSRKGWSVTLIRRINRQGSWLVLTSTLSAYNVIRHIDVLLMTVLDLPITGGRIPVKLQGIRQSAFGLTPLPVWSSTGELDDYAIETTGRGLIVRLPPAVLIDAAAMSLRLVIACLLVATLDGHITPDDTEEYIVAVNKYRNKLPGRNLQCIVSAIEGVAGPKSLPV